MKKFITILACVSILFSKTQIISEIPPAQIFYINLEPQICNTKCLQDLIKNELYISFLARYNEQYSTNDLRSFFDTLNAENEISMQQNRRMGTEADVNIAVLTPQKVIKSYSLIVTNAIFSYVLKRGINANIKFFLTDDESAIKLSNGILNLKKQGFKYVIAPLTNNGISTISKPQYSDLVFYIPTLNTNSTSIKAENIFFGGIDYKDQIDKLLEYSNAKVAVFFDGSRLGNTLNNYILSVNQNAYIKEISGNKLNLNPILQNNSRLKNASIFLNTPLIKTALLSSQFRVFNLDPYAILSTQINYNNALLSLTQPLDRKNMYIANSISTLDDEITTINEILGQNITYDWVAYSTIFGFDFLYTNFINTDANPLLNEQVIENQVIYNTKIMKTTQFGFYSLDENNETSSGSSLPSLP
ncbi:MULTISPECIES: hypothetical protein [Campylobacter]|uniref:hypothetical protein n=1 Tax=Campylobacter TaxID=194 RepID=UPI00138E1109|nr:MULTISPECIES: hypothetical protein [Campylobacter]MDV2490959.1 hypothetical protein [Campylobacter sp. TJR-1]